MIKAFACFVGAVGAVAIVSAQSSSLLPQELRKVLDRQLASIVDSVDGVVGYAAIDLTSGEEIGRLERQEFPTASTIKLSILYELFRQVDEGRISLDASMPLDRTKVVGGSGILQAMGTPALSVRDYAVLMMSLSDNTATNVLIDRVTIPAIAARMQSAGLAGIRLRRKMMDGAAAARGDENVATPRDIARLLRMLHTGEGLKPESKAAALKILEVGAGGYLRRGVPPDIEVLNKPGELEGVRADGAIIRARNRPYAVVVMTTYMKEEDEGERAIASVSRAFYGYFSRLGFGSEYGRQLKRP